MEKGNSVRGLNHHQTTLSGIIILTLRMGIERSFDTRITPDKQRVDAYNIISRKRIKLTNRTDQSLHSPPTSLLQFILNAVTPITAKGGHLSLRPASANANAVKKP